MTGAFDNTFLTLLLNPKAQPRPNPATGKPATHHKLRIEALIDRLSEKKGKLIIPTTSLSEALVSTDKQQEYIDMLESFSCVDIVSFDQRAALELALITKSAIDSGAKKAGVEADWQQVKFDRQIVAIAKVSGATTLYTDDDPQTAFARIAGLKVVHTWELPLPAEYAQYDMLEGLEDDDKKSG